MTSNDESDDESDDGPFISDKDYFTTLDNSLKAALGDIEEDESERRDS